MSTPKFRPATYRKEDAEFIIPLHCGKQVWTAWGSLLGYCTRELGHKGGHTHLIDRTTIHRVHKGTGLVYYATRDDYVQDIHSLKWTLVLPEG